MITYRRGKQIREYQAIYYFFCRHLCFVDLDMLDIAVKKLLDCGCIYIVRASVETRAAGRNNFLNFETTTATVLLPY